MNLLYNSRGGLKVGYKGILETKGVIVRKFNTTGGIIDILQDINIYSHPASLLSNSCLALLY